MNAQKPADLPLTISWFETAEPKGPALGDPERTTWGAFTSIVEHRREGEKDGPAFVPSRTAIALDIETNRKTGESPPPPEEAVAQVGALGVACVIYTSHNHHPQSDIRYRIVLPLSAEIAHGLPAPEVMADCMGLLGVLDRSKIGAQSLFYLPSSPHGLLDQHQTVVVPGAPIMAGWITTRAGALLARRQAEAERQAAEAHAEAAARREARLGAGFNHDDSLIEKLRLHFDLDSVLRAHGYDKQGSNYRHPNSGSGSYGANIKIFGGIDRVYSHNSNDPLHACNLPGWCDGVTALDAFDVVTILDFGGDRTRALRELAQRFDLIKIAERKVMANLLFRLIRQQADQEVIEASAFTEGKRLGLSRDEVCSVAVWVERQATTRAAA